MILFKPWNAPLIVSGRKTQTRRLWKRRRCKPGSFHWAQTRMLDTSSRFAKLRILSVRQEPLYAITANDVYAEGFDSADAFVEAWRSINGTFDAMAMPWVVTFVVDEVV